MVRWACAAALAAISLTSCAGPGRKELPTQIRTQSGLVEGIPSTDGKVRAFEGIPFAAPPVGKLRWQAPQPVAAWEGVKKATAFGSRCMQAPIYSDMIFRDPGPSEDCLYLNVWTPAQSADANLPVMVWIYGGGFAAGATSEPRQDGAKLAEKGVVVVSMNYRLGIFGFLAHPELTKESPHHASGNYGLLDQAAALDWVHNNIAAFGGNPGKVTIFGESAGSISVSAQMASPLSKDLIHGAIGESGSMFMLQLPTLSLAQAEKQGEDFGKSIGAANLEALRAMPAQELLDKVQQHKAMFRFWPVTDGYFFPEQPSEIYAQGKQAHVPLLAGWNKDEGSANSLFGKKQQTLANYKAKLKEWYGKNANQMLKLYPAANEAEMKESAGALAGDRFIAYSTWKWIEDQLGTGGSPVYRYHFEQAPPQPAGEASHGAYHSADIEYVFEALGSKKLPWTDDDRKLSDMMSSYWTNFAKTGNPNGAGLPNWPQNATNDGYQVMHLIEGAAQNPHAAPDTRRERYKMLDQIAKEKSGKATPNSKKQ